MNNIREARMELGLKQEEFAEMLGIDAPLLSKLENGIVDPTASMNEIVFKALASHSNARKGSGSSNSSKSEKNPLKTGIYASILEALKYSSREQPITREMLKTWTKCGDRQNRKAIAELRKAGCPIGSSSSVKGYWLCRTEEDIEPINKMLKSKAIDMLQTAAAMNRNIPGQIGFSNVEGENNLYQD